MNGGLSRRRFMQLAGMGAGYALFAGSAARFAYAATPAQSKLLVVILRGAMDGLGAVIPHSDSRYTDIRGSMAMPLDDAALLPIDGDFSLHAALRPLADMYAQKQLLIMHSVASPYRDRSHFDAQNLLEIGGDTPHSLPDGWLNRTVAALHGRQAIAIGPAIPLMLRGRAEVGSWAPSVLPDVDEDYLMRVMHMYQSDPLLLSAIGNANDMQAIAGNAMNGRGGRNFVALMEKAAGFMHGATGASIGTVELSGWDTHAGQGLAAGKLANSLAMLAEGLVAYRKGMGAEWQQTAMLVLTEFGRTVKGNGTGGTDHGTGSVAFLLGGNVLGGRMAGDWPGLSKLYEDRDLIPANDMRGLIKAVLHQHLGLDEAHIEAAILPHSQPARMHERLFALKS